MLNANGTVHSEARHYPYGEERWSSGTLPTDYRFTGQRSEAGLGLVHMGARHYDPALGHWVSPDTVVPDPANSKGFNRYSFVLGNPLRYRDPSGHYHSDVHQDLTRKWTYVSVLQLARTYGMGIEEANALATNLSEKVANADQAVDCKVCSDSSARTSGVLHWMNHKEANANMAEVVQSGDPEAVGRALHAIQDYFAHFGQGLVLENEEDGRKLYERLLKQDDFDPSEHGGLDLEKRLENAGRKIPGHAGLTWPDDYDPADAWDQLMRDESQFWIQLFVLIYFEQEYGPLPEEESYQE